MKHATRLYVMPLIAIATFSNVGCAVTLQARAYNLNTGEMLQISFRYTGSGRGAIEFRRPSGETCSGEYVTVAGGSTAWGSVFASVYSPSGSVSGSGLAYTGSIENKQKGTAIATCEGGVVLECEYVTSAWKAQGYGACKDNRGQKYKLMF